MIESKIHVCVIYERKKRDCYYVHIYIIFTVVRASIECDCKFSAARCS